MRTFRLVFRKDIRQSFRPYGLIALYLLNPKWREDNTEQELDNTKRFTNIAMKNMLFYDFKMILYYNVKAVWRLST